MEALDYTPLWDKAYAALRSAILEGRFSPGDRLLLREVAAKLQISLTPVRDAVNRLVAERVLERGAPGQGGGAIVPRMTADQLRELLVIRGDLEGRATSVAAARATPEDVRALEALLKQMLTLIQQNKLDRYLGVHRKFHFRIYSTAGMGLLEEMIDTLWLRSSPALTYVIPAYVPLLKGTDFHRAAVEAIKRGDPAEAEASIRADIAQAGDYVLSLADQEGRLVPPGAVAEVVGILGGVVSG